MLRNIKSDLASGGASGELKGKTIDVDAYGINIIVKTQDGKISYASNGGRRRKRAHGMTPNLEREGFKNSSIMGIDTSASLSKLPMVASVYENKADSLLVGSRSSVKIFKSAYNKNQLMHDSSTELKIRRISLASTKSNQNLMFGSQKD